MLETLEAVLGAAGLTLKSVLAAAIGSFISLNFFDGLSTRERWSTFIGGFAIGAYGGTPVTALLELPAKVELFITVLMALFGMSIAAAVIKVIRETDWKSIIQKRVNREGG